MKLKLPNWGSLCNPNLLMNSDYRSGIINQKGITSLDKSDGSTELGIDGWILYGINIAVGSNYVTFANRTSANHTVQQPLDIKGLKAGDKVTFYASCFNITGNVYIYMTGLDAQKKKLINGDNEFTFTLTSALERFYIELAPNAVVSFNCKKLEIGEHFTGMPAWNEKMELLKCEYYYDNQIVTVNTIYDYENNEYGFYISFVGMHKIPSINLLSVSSYGSDGRWRNASEKSVQQVNDRTAFCKCKFVQSLKNPSNQLVVEFTMDSYDYYDVQR